MKRVIAVLAGFSLQCSLWAAVANGNAVRVALLPEVAVSGDEILLSHLVADPIPQALRSYAKAVSFGKTPEFGSVRRLRAPLVSAALSNSGLKPDEFEIPAVITIHRAGRFVTDGEIKAAVNGFLQQANEEADADVTMFAVAPPESLAVPEGELHLYIKGAKYDAALRHAQLSLASRAFPQLSPFTVEVHGATQDFRTKDSHPAGADSKKGPMLIQAGAPAELIVTAADTQMILSVVPLKSGREGDVIRVRLAKSTKFLSAKVVAKDRLEASY